ncbi:hypothetical protein ACRERI_05395 [Methanothermobacter thermautotrophicus]|uniref:hypothetical protein n=1 Tax=Methanothermobacter thermautotrophicus TaxID=145262 RepID=UPI003C7F84B2
MSAGVMISVFTTLALGLLTYCAIGEERMNRFYERVTGEKAKKGGERTPKAISFSLIVFDTPFLLLLTGFSFVFAPIAVPAAVALAILLWYIGFVFF